MNPGSDALAVCSCSFRCLLSCLVGDQQGVAQWLSATLAAGEDPVALAGDHRLSPLLYQRLHDYGLLDQLPPGQRERLQASNRRVMLRQAAAYSAVHTVLDLLREADIEVLPVKGVALAALLWPEPLLRHMDDVDLLLAPGDIQAAERLVLAAGFKPAPGRWSPSPFEYHLPIMEKAGAALELHWQLWSPSPLQPFSLPSLADLLPRARPAVLLERELPVPSPADQLLIVAAGLAQEGFSTRLRHWADLYWLAPRLTDKDWRQASELACEMRLEGMLVTVFRFLAELTGLQSPFAQQEASEEVEAAWQRLQPLLWRRLTEPRPLRASFWLRMALTGYRPAADWREELPEYLREQVPHGQSAVALQRIGGGAVAMGKLISRVGTLAISSAARRALREEVLISKTLWGLAERERGG